MRVAAGGRVLPGFIGFVLLGLVAVSHSAPGAAQSPPGSPQRWDGLIERLSTPGQGYPESFANPRMSRHAVSADGRYFVFMAEEPNPPYEPYKRLFVRDRLTGQTMAYGPAPLAAPPVISADGSHRAVELCDGTYRPDGAPICDVFTIDERTFRFESMSTAIDGTLSQGDSSEPMLSRDGRFIVFRTNSPTLLPPGAAPGQIVLRDRDTDFDGILDEPDASSLRVVSVSRTGQPGNAESAAAEVSADGRFVAFRSRASNLVPGDTNETWDVFLHDVETGVTRRINVRWDGRQTTPADDSAAISMSEDGAFVAFAGDDWALSDPTTSSDDNNNALDVFVYDRVANTLSRVDLGAGGSLGNGDTHWPTLSADGRYVSVVSNATNVTNPGSPGRSHVFVYDRATSQATRVSINPDGTDPDRDAAYSTISADGSVVTFISQATNLPTAAAPDTDTIYAAVHFDVSPLTLTVPARGGQVQAMVTAQQYVLWEGRPADWTWLDWGSLGAYGMGNGTASFRAERHYGLSPRSTTVAIGSKAITVTQEPGLFLTSFSPAQGPPAGGTLVSVRGTGFEPGMQVYFDGIPSPAVEFVDTTELRAVTPPHDTGEVWIYVATGDWNGSAVSNEMFRYLDATPPQIFPWTSGNQTLDGWFTSDVQIEFLSWDPESEVVHADGCALQFLRTDTAATTYTCTATSEGGTATASLVVKRDATGPAIDVTGLAQKVYRVGDPAPVPSYTCADAFNGVTECIGMLEPGTPVDMSPGHHQFWVNARDGLGNWSTRFVHYAVTAGGCAPRPDGLVAWFPFETISGGTPEPNFEELVNRSDGAPFNTQFVAGAVGAFAMASAGPGSYVATEPYETFRMTSAFTLAAWVKPGEGTGEIETIAGREGEYLLGISPDGTLHWQVSTATRPWNWGWTNTGLQLDRDVWAHVALVYDGNNLTTYLNGSPLSGAFPGGPIVDAAPELNQFRMGGREGASSSYFTGAIDDVLLLARALQPADLARIALAERDGLCGPRPTTITVTPDSFTVPYGATASDVFTVTLKSEGSPVAGRRLLFFDPTGYLLAPGETDGNGQIRFGGTAVGSTVGSQPGFSARFLGDFYYTASSGANVLVVEPGTPVITWPTPASVAYGTLLGPAQLNASANVAGTFTYSPAAGTPLLSVGTHTLTVRFDPQDTTHYRSTTATTTVSVVDLTRPVIVPSAEGTLGENGWYTSDVRITFSVHDPESAIYSTTGCDPVTLATDIVGTSYTCIARSEGGTATATIVVKRDTTAPQINLVTPAATLYETNLAFNSNYSCTDSVSGTASCAGPVPNGTPFDRTPGYRTFTVVATDKAGNRSTKEVTYAVGMGQGAPRPAGFVAWWPFEEPYSGSGTMASYRDAVSGTVDTGVNTDWRFGQGPVGVYAMSTAASPSAYMSAGTREQLRLAGAFTISAWLWPTVTEPHGVIVGREGEYMLARFSDGTLRYSLATTSPGWGWINTGHVLGRVWSQVVLTYDGAFVRAFVNGREVHVAPASGPIGDAAPTLNEFRVGARQDTSSGLWHLTGGIDDLQLYNRALDPSEIERVFFAGIKGLCGPINTYFDVQPNPVRVTYNETREVEIVARLTNSTAGGAPFAGRPVKIFQNAVQIASGTTDANGELRATATVRGVWTGTSHTEFRVEHAGDFYFAAQTRWVPLITEKATPQITWAAPQAIVYGSALSAAQLNATASTGGTFAYSPAAGAVLTAGTHTLSVTFTPWVPQNYTTATTTVPIEVIRATPTISVAAPAATYDGLPHGATGTVTGVGGAALGPLTVTYNGGSAVPVNAGAYDVVASFAGDANYAEASASATLTIAKAGAAVTAVGGSYTYDGAAHHATGTVTGVGGVELGPLTFTYNGASAAPVNAGTYAVVASFAGNANHAAASATATLTIAKAAATVTAVGGSYTYDGAPHAATGTVAGVAGAVLGPLSFTYNGSSDVPVNAGTYEVVASFAGDANHTAASASATLTIAKAAATVTAVGGSYAFDGAPHAATGTVTGAGGAELAPLTFTYNGASEVPINAGTYAVVASFAGDANHTAASASATVTIAKAAATVTAVGGSYTYDGAAHAASGTVTGVGGTTLGPLSFTYNGASDAPVNAGTYEVVASFAGDANHTAVSATATLTVAKAAATVTAVGGDYTYDGASHAASGTATGAGGTALGPLTITYNGSSNAPVSAGTYEVVASFAGDANHTAASATTTLTIAKAAASVAAVGGSYTYDGAAHAASGTVTGAGGVALGALTFTYNGASAAPVTAGTYEVIASFAGDANHAAASATATLTIAKATATVTAVGGSYTYDGAAHPATGTVTGIGGASLGPLTFTYNAASDVPVNAGTYAVVASFAGDANHAAASATATLTIGKAAMVLQWVAPAVITYGTPLGTSQLNATANIAGTFTYSPAGGAVLGAGTHTLSVTFTPADAANYTGGSASTTLTIARAPLTIRAADAVKRFGAPLPAFTAAAAGFVNGDSVASLGGTLVLATAAAQQSPVGAYPIVPSGVSSPNYTIAFVNGTLTVLRGSVDVTLSTAPEPSGFEAPMTFTASVAASIPSPANPDGVVHFYDGAVLIGSAPLAGGIATLSTAGLDAGTRTIEARFGGDASFEPGTVSAAHVIRDASQTPSLVLSSSRNPSNTGQSVTLTAVVSMPSGPVAGEVQFYSGAVLLGSLPISAGRATFTTASLAAGSHAITARYVGAAGIPPSRSDVFVQSVGASGWKNRATSMAVTLAPTTATLGDTVVVTADVAGSSSVAPTGRILFMVDGVVVAETAASATSATAAQATISVPGLAHGRHAISVTYLGDPTYKGSTARVTAVVN